MTSFNSIFDNVDISSRPKRRKTVSLIIKELTLICERENAYMERIPENLQDGDAYADAENSVDTLNDAIMVLMDAY
jgi:hypothetical protein